MANTFFSFILGMVVLGVILAMSKNLWMTKMNLVNRKDFISDEQVYQKLNRLMESGEVSLYAHNWSGETSYSLNFTYRKDKNGLEEKAENRIRNTNVNTAINDAYAWASQRGYIKE